MQKGTFYGYLIKYSKFVKPFELINDNVAIHQCGKIKVSYYDLTWFIESLYCEKFNNLDLVYFDDEFLLGVKSEFGMTKEKFEKKMKKFKEFCEKYKIKLSKPISVDV